MSEQKQYPVPEQFQNAWMTQEKYQSAYKASISEPEAFWSHKANKFIDWIQPWETLFEGDFAAGQVSWFKGAKLNACFNCIDRHLPSPCCSDSLYLGRRYS